jgi:hypothetical protein
MINGLDGVTNALYDLPNDLSNGRPLLTTKQRMFIIVESVIAFPSINQKCTSITHTNTVKLYNARIFTVNSPHRREDKSTESGR